MTNIIIEQVDGKLVGYDKETGERVPININGVPVNPDGTIDVEHIDGEIGGGGSGSSWTLNDDDVLEPAGDYPISVDELNSTTWVGDGDDLASAVNGGQTGLYILVGDATASETVTVSAGQIVRGTGDSTVAPDGDFPVFEIADSSGQINPRIEDLEIDVTGLSTYSSGAIKFTDAHDYSDGYDHVSNVVIDGDSTATSDSSGLYFESTNGGSVSRVTCRNVRVQFFGKAISEYITGGGFINGNRLEGIYSIQCDYGVHQEIDSGEINGSSYELTCGGLSSMTTAYLINGHGHHIADHSFDINLTQNDFAVLNGDNNALVLKEGRQNVLRFVKNVGLYNRIENPVVTRDVWRPQTQYPSWLSESGTGSVSSATISGHPAIELTTGGSADDEIVVSSPDSNLFRRGSEAMMDCRALIPSGNSDWVVKVGYDHDSGGFTGFVIDDTDSLGTGITGNWIAYHEYDGTVLSQDTGVSVSAGEYDLRVAASDGAGEIYLVLDGNEVASFTFDPVTWTNVSPRFSVQQKSTSSVLYRIMEQVTLTYQDD